MKFDSTTIMNTSDWNLIFQLEYHLRVYSVFFFLQSRNPNYITLPSHGAMTNKLLHKTLECERYDWNKKHYFKYNKHTDDRSSVKFLHDSFQMLLFFSSSAINVLYVWKQSTIHMRIGKIGQMHFLDRYRISNQQVWIIINIVHRMTRVRGYVLF